MNNSSYLQHVALPSVFHEVSFRHNFFPRNYPPTTHFQSISFSCATSTFESCCHQIFQSFLHPSRLLWQPSVHCFLEIHLCRRHGPITRWKQRPSYSSAFNFLLSNLMHIQNTKYTNKYKQEICFKVLSIIDYKKKHYTNVCSTFCYILIS